MKAVLITTGNQIQTVELTQPLHRSLNELVGGWIEIVRGMNMKRPYLMICNEDYCNLNLPGNFLGSYFYGTQIHGHPVLGNIVIMKERGEELEGLDDIEIRIIHEECSSLLHSRKL